MHGCMHGCMHVVVVPHMAAVQFETRQTMLPEMGRSSYPSRVAHHQDEPNDGPQGVRCPWCNLKHIRDRMINDRPFQINETATSLRHSKIGCTWASTWGPRKNLKQKTVQEKCEVPARGGHGRPQKRHGQPRPQAPSVSPDCKSCNVSIRK